MSKREDFPIGTPVVIHYPSHMYHGQVGKLARYYKVGDERRAVVDVQGFEHHVPAHKINYRYAGRKSNS